MEKELENHETSQDEITNKEVLNANVSCAILASLDLEMNFKLYSYRVITPEQFLDRAKMVLYNFNTTLK